MGFYLYILIFFFFPCFQMWRAAFTELIGTACLIFTLTSSIISCLESSQSVEPKFVIPFVAFIIFFLFFLVTIPLSGGHMNPIISLIFALKGVVTPVRGLIYILAQCVASIMASAVIQIVMNKNTAEKYSLGGCMINANGQGISSGTALVLEVVCLFIVLFVALTVTFEKRRFKGLGLQMICVIISGSIGFVFFVSMSVTGKPGYSGVALMPARCLGPLLLQGGSLWYGYWVPWVGSFIACIAYYGFTLTLPRESMMKEEEEQDIL